MTNQILLRALPQPIQRATPGRCPSLFSVPAPYSHRLSATNTATATTAPINAGIKNSYMRASIFPVGKVAALH